MDNIQDIVSFRRALHARPELSDRETETARTIARVLARSSPNLLIENLGGMQTGLCAVYESGHPGPAVLVRAELDALPIQETNDFSHRSQVAGVSHKCGHDGHMATLVSLANGLRERPPGRGRVYLLFQPAEETGRGASQVLADERFRALIPPDFVYAFHNVPKYPLGQVLVREGLFAQASVGFNVHFRGKTSHLSYPEHGINPSAAVTTLITEVNAMDTGLAKLVQAPVLGTISYAELGVSEKGPNFGTTPGEACVTGVLRAHLSDDLERMRTYLAQLAERLAAESQLTQELSWHEPFAATESHKAAVEVVERAARQCGLNIERLEQPFRWSEDFGQFTQAFTGAFFGLGSGVDQPQLHDSSYDYPDDLIAIGASLYRAIVDQHLG